LKERIKKKEVAPSFLRPRPHGGKKKGKKKRKNRILSIPLILRAQGSRGERKERGVLQLRLGNRLFSLRAASRLLRRREKKGTRRGGGEGEVAGGLFRLSVPLRGKKGVGAARPLCLSSHLRRRALEPGRRGKGERGKKREGQRRLHSSSSSSRPARVHG